ncbi:MAG: 50S ribosomal protein L30 [Acidimicrobiales bacterium]
MATKSRSQSADLVVTQVRSAISAKPKHRATLRALGLKRIGASREVPDRPEIRGMLNAVAHLIEVHQSTAQAPRNARVETEETT